MSQASSAAENRDFVLGDSDKRTWIIVAVLGAVIVAVVWLIGKK